MLTRKLLGSEILTWLHVFATILTGIGAWLMLHLFNEFSCSYAFRVLINQILQENKILDNLVTWRFQIFRAFFFLLPLHLLYLINIGYGLYKRWGKPTLNSEKPIRMQPRIAFYITLGVIAISLIPFVTFTKPKAAKPPAAKELRAGETFTGNFGVIKKGKLLDQNFKAAYDSLPEKLGIIEFGQEFFVTTHLGQHTYSWYNEPPTDSLMNELVELNKGFTYQDLLSYLKLAERGKATFPTIVLWEDETLGGMVPTDKFREKYGDHFHNLPNGIPYTVKDLMLEFLNSSEGKDFDLADDLDMRRKAVMLANYTNCDQMGVAVTMTNWRNSNNAFQQLILVYGCDEKKDYQLLYKEYFSRPFDWEIVDADPDKEDSVYLDTDEKQLLPFVGIRLSRYSPQDLVLAYDSTSKTIKRYVQPAADDEEEREGDGGGRRK